MLSIEGLAVGRDGRAVARIETATIQPGQAALLLGPSGSGKSTALFTLAGLLAPIGGQATLGGEPITAERPRPARGVGVVFQDMHLMSGLSVIDNARLGVFARGDRQDRAAAEAVLSRLGLGDKMDRPAERLSRGEAQRVALARALLMEPRLLLADEPTASLDDENTAVVADLLASAAAESGAALIIATHDRRLIDRFPARIALEGAAT